MTDAANQIVAEIRQEVSGKIANMKRQENTLQSNLESDDWNGQYVSMGDKYVGPDFQVLPPVNMEDLATVNCPAFVIPRHFISG